MAVGHAHPQSVQPYIKNTFDSANNALTKRQIMLSNIYKLQNINMDIHNIDLNIGETQRTNCPHCGGYNTFTITNDDGNLVWNCYKLSCNVRGKKKTILSSEDLVALFNKKDKDVCEFVLPSCIVLVRTGRVL